MLVFFHGLNLLTGPKVKHHLLALQINFPLSDWLASLLQELRHLTHIEALLLPGLPEIALKAATELLPVRHRFQVQAIPTLALRKQ